VLEERLGFFKNLLARILISHRSNLVGLLVQLSALSHSDYTPSLNDSDQHDDCGDNQ